jgi:inorganic pyrophosphatase
VLSTIPLLHGLPGRGTAIGLFHLIDKGKADEKVLPLPLGDPYAEGMADLQDIPSTNLEGDRALFRVYKDLGRRQHETGDSKGAEAARGAIERAIALYGQKFGAA